MAYDWTGTALQRLRDMWAKGLTATQIGRELGCTKNAILGKIHRLGLSGRPSPLNLGGKEAVRVSRMVDGKATIVIETRDKSRTVKPAGAERQEPKKQGFFPPVRTALAPVVIPTAPRLPRQEKATPLGSKSPNRWGPTCCWIYGDPKKDGLRFCEELRREGKPYCARHCEVAFVPNVKRPEAA